MNLRPPQESSSLANESKIKFASENTAQMYQELYLLFVVVLYSLFVWRGLASMGRQQEMIFSFIFRI